MPAQGYTARMFRTTRWNFRKRTAGESRWLAQRERGRYPGPWRGVPIQVGNEHRRRRQFGSSQAWRCLCESGRREDRGLVEIKGKPQKHRRHRKAGDFFSVLSVPFVAIPTGAEV